MSLEIKLKVAFLREFNAIATSKQAQIDALREYPDFEKCESFVKEQAPGYGLSIYSFDTQAHLLACIKYAYDKTLETVKTPANHEALASLLEKTVKPLICTLVRKPTDYVADSIMQTETETALHYISINAAAQVKRLSSPSLLTQVGTFFRQNQDEVTIGTAAGLVLATAAAAVVAFRK